MYRVVTFVSDHRGHQRQENGPWLRIREEAEQWCSLLRAKGYIARLESMNGELFEEGGDRALRAAMENMA